MHENGLKSLVGGVDYVYFLNRLFSQVDIVEFDIVFVSTYCTEGVRIIAGIVYDFVNDDARRLRIVGFFAAEVNRAICLLKCPMVAAS